jgi:hypothetical protein
MGMRMRRRMRIKMRVKAKTGTWGWVYLLREREFVKSGEEVCKTGMTRRGVMTRLNEYPKGSVLLYCTFCANVYEAERESIELLSKHFKARRDIGAESFEGNTRVMVGLLASLHAARILAGPDLVVVSLLDESDSADVDVMVTNTPATDVAPQPTEPQPPAPEPQPEPQPTEPQPEPIVKLMIDNDIAIARFVDSLGPRSGLRVPSLDLFEQFLVYAAAQDTWKTSTVAHTKFSKAIVHNYAATSEVIRDGTGMQRIIACPEDAVQTNVGIETSHVAQWCEENLEVTGDMADVVALGELGHRTPGIPRFKALVKAFYAGVNDVVYVDRMAAKRHVVKGVVLRRTAF